MVSLLLMFYSFFLVHCLILLGGNKLEADTELALPKEGGGLSSLLLYLLGDGTCLGICRVGSFHLLNCYLLLFSQQILLLSLFFDENK